MPLDEAVAAVIEPGDIATAVVVAAHAGDTRLERVYGNRYDGRAASLTDISPLYCATAPALAVAVLTLLDEGRLDLGTTIDQKIDWLAGHWLGRLTVGELLNHRTDLHRAGNVPMLAEPNGRAALFMQMPEAPAGQAKAYADFGVPFLLAHLIEEVCERDFRQFVRERVTERYGASLRELNVGIPHDMLEAWWPDLSLNVYGRRETGLHPLATEGARIWACDWNPAFAGYGTAAGLLAFYGGVLADIEGAGIVLHAETIRDATSAREVYVDERLAGDASFGLGFMTQLGLFGLGERPSQRSFGHMSIGCESVAFADPEHGLAAAILINAVHDHTSDAVQSRRANLVTALYEELGL